MGFIVWGSDWNSSTPIPAVRVAEGVKPKGSVWTRNPIPSGYGHMHDTPSNYPFENDPVFPASLPGLHWGGVGPWCATPHDGSQPCFQASPALWFMLRGTVVQGGGGSSTS